MQSLVNRLAKWFQWLEQYRGSILTVLLLISTIAAGLEITGVLNSWNIPISPSAVIIFQVIVLFLMLSLLASSPELVGFLLLILGVYIGFRGYLYLYSDGFSNYQFTSDFYANLSSELISIAITVLIIDRLNEQRGTKLLKARLIREMSSNDNSTALRAIGELRGHGWLEDGSLKKHEMWNANLESAILHNANLSQVDFGRANLCNCDLREANLNNTILTEVKLTNARIKPSQLVEVYSLRNAIMPDGLRYDGRYNLIGDLQKAQQEGVNLKDPNEMASYYHILLEDYLAGQNKFTYRFNNEWERVFTPNLPQLKIFGLPINWIPMVGMGLTLIGIYLGHFFSRIYNKSSM